MLARRLCALVVVMSTSGLFATAAGAVIEPGGPGVAPAGAASRANATRQARPGRMPVPLRSVTASNLRAGRGRVSGVRASVSTPGRVQQLAGEAGYAFDTPSTVALSTTVTVPTLQCAGVPLFERNAQPGLQQTLEVGGQYAMVQSFCAAGGAPGSYQQYNYLNFSLTGIPYQPTGYLGTLPGAHIQLSETADATSLTATINAPGQGFTKSFTVSGSWAGSAFVGALDYSESSTGGVPAYNPVAFASTTMNGSSLGSYLGGSPAPHFSEQNSVWGATLQDQTSDIGAGDSFSITNANQTLPTVLVSTAATGVKRPASGAATITFTVALSFAGTSPAYLDYATQDDGAVAGSDYTPKSGTLAFPPGTTSRKVSVPVLAGPESGGEIDFLLVISNPSYAYNPLGSAGVGRIYTGPTVLQVTPDVVRLGGGGSMTLTGVFFGPAGSPDTVKFCASGCVTAASSTVLSDTTIKLAVPDLSGIDPSGNAPFTADAVVTDAQSVSSPISSSDEVHVGCQQVANQVDGLWSYSGCVTHVDSTNAVTTQASQLDGLDVSASRKDQVDYSTGGAAGNAVSSTGTSTVSLNVAGQLVAIFRGALSKPLTGPVSFAPPPKTTIEGMALAGPVTLTPGAIGQANGTVSVTVPPWLGSGTATMTFTSSAAGGLSNLQVEVPQASFANLLDLSGVVMSWSSQSGWQLNGTASIGGAAADAAGINGSATYVNNKLTAANLSIPGSVSVFGLFNVSALSFTYSTADGWSAQATLSSDNGPGALSFSATSDATGNITKASLTIDGTTNPVLVQQTIALHAFTLTYATGVWSATAIVPVGEKGTLTGSVTVAGGVVQSGSLVLKKLTLWGWLSVKTASLTYSLLNGQQIWMGNLDVRLADQATPLYGIQVAWKTVDGAQTAGGIGLVGNVPIPFLSGLFLNQLGGTLQWAPPPAQIIEAHATIGLGPLTPEGQLASLDGSFVRTERQIPLVGSYTYTGTLNIFTVPAGTASVDLNDNGVTTITLSLGPGNGVPLSVGPVSLIGQLVGSWSTTTFSLDGTASITLQGQGTFSGTVHVERKGMAACDGSARGFKWIFGQTPVLQKAGHCTTAGF